MASGSMFLGVARAMNQAPITAPMSTTKKPTVTITPP